MVIKALYNDQEFVRISYLVTHKFKDSELNDNIPEDFQFDQLKRIIKSTHPIIKTFDINWS